MEGWRIENTASLTSSVAPAVSDILTRQLVDESAGTVQLYDPVDAAVLETTVLQVEPLFDEYSIFTESISVDDHVIL